MIEILIVIVILAIAAMTAIPMMSSAGTVQLKSAASMIAADLEYAKSLAISRGQNFTVVFDTAAESYTIQDQGGSTVPHPVKKGFDYLIDLASEGLDRVDIASVDFDGNSQIQFDYLGSPDNGGTVQLQTNSITTTVNVEPVTGYISISE
jgi:Tfp pilus assembly protein FimT